MQQPDKLFREKLENYNRPAPSGAWNKIEANFEPKSKKALWLKIAASLLLIAMAGYYFIMPSDRHNTMTSDQVNKQPDKAHSERKIEPSQIASNTIVELDDQPIVKSQSKSVVKNQKAIKSSSIANDGVTTDPSIDAQNASIIENKFIETADTSSITVTTEMIAPNVVNQESTGPNEEEHSTTLVYTAAEVDKYLIKNDDTEATSDTQKQSTFKKLLTKAYDLKNNQDALGDLRQKKNEILALNFKKEKRGQNK